MKIAVSMVFVAMMESMIPAYGMQPFTKLNLAACRPPAAELLGGILPLFGPHAVVYEPYIVVCPVNAPSGATVLRIAAMRVDRAAADNNLYFVGGKPWNGIDGAALDQSDPVPRPVILDMAGKAVGVLPELLFPDGPGVTSVRFLDWHDGWPSRISLRVDGAAVLGAFCPPSLVWRGADAGYVQAPGAEIRACP